MSLLPSSASNAARESLAFSHCWLYVPWQVSSVFVLAQRLLKWPFLFRETKLAACNVTFLINSPFFEWLSRPPLQSSHSPHSSLRLPHRVFCLLPWKHLVASVDVCFKIGDPSLSSASPGYFAYSSACLVEPRCVIAPVLYKKISHLPR